MVSARQPSIRRSLLPARSRCALILAMCQSEEALQRLAHAQAAGALVINSPQAIRSCYRDRLGGS